MAHIPEINDASNSFFEKDDVLTTSLLLLKIIYVLANFVDFIRYLTV